MEIIKKITIKTYMYIIVIRVEIMNTIAIMATEVAIAGAGIIHTIVLSGMDMAGTMIGITHIV